MFTKLVKRIWAKPDKEEPTLLTLPEFFKRVENIKTQYGVLQYEEYTRMQTGEAGCWF